MTQPEFAFDAKKLHRRRGPDTSIAAAEAAEPVVTGDQLKILGCLSFMGRPMAAEQIAYHTTLDKVAINRRFGEMVDKNLIRRTDLRHQNRSGRWAAKYEIVA